jgi:uncharacterized protein YdcH (DUF465 family)
MDNRSQTRERLLKDDVRFRHLADEHQQFEERLESLQSRRWLSDQEELEKNRLKKKKLSIKDQMESMLQQCAVE